jgi:hypothetical protein
MNMKNYKDFLAMLELIGPPLFRQSLVRTKMTNKTKIILTVYVSNLKPKIEVIRYFRKIENN